MAKHGVLRVLMAACVLAFGLSGSVPADGVGGVSASATFSCPDPVKARKFDDSYFGLQADVSGLLQWSCSFKAENKGTGNSNRGRKGVKVAFDVQFRNSFGTPVGANSSSGKTKGSGFTGASFQVPANASSVSARANISGSKTMQKGAFECYASDAPPCQQDEETLCLDGDRFQVEVDWRDFDKSTGPGMVISSGNNTGSFYFFNPNSANLVVQLLDNCKFNDHFWVFASAATNVEYELTVTDTVTGFTRTYENQLGQPAPAITDTSAFATCP